MQPLCTALCFYVESWGYHINFGRARAVGSLCYSASMLVLGTLVERTSADAIPLSLIAVMVICGVVALLFGGTQRRSAPPLEQERSDAQASSSLGVFVSQNKRFVVFLVGVALSSMFTGGTALIQYFCDDVMVATVVYWTFGSLGRAGWRDIAIIAVLTFGAFGYFIYNRWNYNAMESGTSTAKSLGVHVDALILSSMVLCALISSVAVAFVGCISFIGLIAPHIMRRFLGNDYRFLIPASALCGSALLILSDIVSRTLLSPTVLPIGALTSFLGAPLFLYLIIKRGGMK